MNSTKYYPIDLHIHSCLSSCASNDMTPKNIIEHILNLGIKVMSVTDHNSCKNLEEVIKESKDKDVVVVPGIEIESKEGAHVLTYFEDLDTCQVMEDIITNNLPDVENSIRFFGNQTIIKDGKKKEHPYLLSQATSLSILKICSITKELNGVYVPAHIQRKANGLISTLGFLPKDIEFNTLEISKINFYKYHKNYQNCNVITNSDAHEIEDLYKSPTTAIRIENKLSINKVLSALKNQNCQSFVFF